MLSDCCGDAEDGGKAVTNCWYSLRPSCSDCTKSSAFMPSPRGGGEIAGGSAERNAPNTLSSCERWLVAEEMAFWNAAAVLLSVPSAVSSALVRSCPYSRRCLGSSPWWRA